MKVFEAIPVRGFEFVQPSPPDDFDSLTSRVDAFHVGDRWVPRPLLLLREDEGKQLERSDAPWLDAHSLVLRPSAVLALKPALSPGDQLLPMKCGSERLYLLKPKWTLDALDEEASEVWRFPDGRLAEIRRHAFREGVIGDLTNFYVTSLRFSPVFHTEPFVQAWERAGLRGLRFKLLWESGNR